MAKKKKKKIEIIEDLQCPLCKGVRAVGNCGMNKWYCRTCYVEFHVKGSEITIYNITSTGGTTLLEVIAK